MSKIDKAVEWAVGIANDPAHGYDQVNRWGPDYDCSSLIIQAYENAGVPVKTKGATYTGNMKKVFLACGFIEVPLKDRQKGDVLLNEGHHTAMMIDSNNIVHASINELGKIVGGKKGDQTGREICTRAYYNYSKGWDCCLRYVEKQETIPEGKPDTYTVVKGDTLTKIAKKFNTTVSELVDLNGIKDKNKIQVGQVLKLKGSAPTVTKPKGYDVEIIAKSGLNVRPTPGTTGKALKVLLYGTKAKVTEERDGWGKISDGWISLKYTRKI